MATQSSEQEIAALFTAYQRIKKYIDRVHFFDQHFNIVPFGFPAFQTDLYKFFSASGVYKLTEFLRIEQGKSSLLERVFYFEKNTYIFSIKPVNSNALVLNNYILTKFLTRNDQLDMVVIQQRNLLRNHAALTAGRFNEAGEMVHFLRRRIGAEFERKASVETKLMAVFIKGYDDYIAGRRRPVHEKRKKFLELYLYAYGFLYAQYMQALDASETHGERPDLERKIALLKELGVVEAIQKKYFSLNREELYMKTAEIVGFITGEHPKKVTDRIGPLLMGQ